MSFYRVIVTETVSRSINVEADSQEDARELVDEMDWRELTIDTEEPSSSEITEVVYLGEDDPLK